jgi:hypothetical protein
MMGYHDLSAAGGPRVSTQDRATREGGEGGHSSEHDGGDAVAGADVAGSQTLRMRAMQRRWIQRKAARADGGGGGGAAAIPGGSGAQLGGDVQKRMERTLGADLSGVRVHTGGDSAEAADSMGARAFTVGGDVHFNRGEFAPGSKEGDRLLAHELTHVVQGQKSGVQRKADPAHGDAEGGGEHGDHEAGGHEVSEPGDPAEHEADAMGDHAAEQLHGGGEQGEGKEAGGEKHGGDAHGGGEHGGGKKVEREKPAVGASAPSVGRKIFRAKSGSKPPPIPKDAKAAKPGAGKAQGAGAAPAGAAPAKSPEEADAEKWCTDALPTLQAYKPLSATDFKDVDGFESKLSPLLAKFKTNKVLLDAKKALADKKSEIEDACITDLTIKVTAALKGLPPGDPSSHAKAGALSVRLTKWKRYFVDAKDGAAGYNAVRDAEKEIADTQAAVLKEREKVLQDALGQIMGVDAEKADASKQVDAAMKVAEPWIAAKGLPDDPKTLKIAESKKQKLLQIEEATKKHQQHEKEAQDKKQKEEQDKQHKAQGQEKPAGGAKPAPEKKKGEDKPADAHAGAATPATAAKPKEAPKHVEPPPHDGAHEGAGPDAKGGHHAPTPTDAKAPAGEHHKEDSHADESWELRQQLAEQKERNELEREQLETEMELACAEFVQHTATKGAWLGALIDLAGLAVPVLHGVGLFKSAGVAAAIVKAELDAKWLTHAIKFMKPDDIRMSLAVMADQERTFFQLKAVLEQFLSLDPKAMAKAKEEKKEGHDKKHVAGHALKSEGPELGGETAGIVGHALHEAIEHGAGPVVGELVGGATALLPFVATAFGIKSAHAAGGKVFDLRNKLLLLQMKAEEHGAKTGRKL